MKEFIKTVKEFYDIKTWNAQTWMVMVVTHAIGAAIMAKALFE